MVRRSGVSCMSDFFDNWMVQMRKGVLELCILRSLEDQERYGYDLVKTLASVPGLALTEGTLYPLLSRLRVAGLIVSRLEESDEGPARKYYSLTKEGSRTLAAMNQFVEKLNQGTRSLNKKIIL
jgi:PadR family transcriptional regulator, regulatory protein PadR